MAKIIRCILTVGGNFKMPRDIIMRKITFEDDEMRVIAMLDIASRQAAQKEIEAVIPFTQDGSGVKCCRNQHC